MNKNVKKKNHKLYYFMYFNKKINFFANIQEY